MRLRTRSASAIVVVAGVLVSFLAGAASAAEQSWLCSYFPSACGSESEPGGLPGHGDGSGGAEQSRGLAPADEPPALEAPAPAEAPAKLPPAEGELVDEKK